MKELNLDKENINKNAYNKPKVIINPYNDQKYKKIFLKNPLKNKNKIKNKNKNFFNSTNNPLIL